MLKEFLWKAFEKTGNLDAYVFYKEIDRMIKPEKNIESTEEEKVAAGRWGLKWVILRQMG